MKSNRRNFIEKACLAGACFCGFSSLAAGTASSHYYIEMGEPDDRNLKFIQDWISNLLLTVTENSSQKECRKIMKPCSAAHYDFLEMDKVLAPYVGDKLTIVNKYSRFEATTHRY